MKYLKVLVITACVPALVMFGVGIASATTLTSPAGTEYRGTIQWQLKEGEAIFISSFIGEIKCKGSTIEGKVEEQGSTSTASGKLSTFDFTGCNGPFTTLKTGSFEIHTDSTSVDGNGTITANGTEITFELVGIHCILTTSNTKLGTVGGGNPAEVVASTVLPRTGGRSGAFCGSSVTFNATYKGVTPETLLVD